MRKPVNIASNLLIFLGIGFLLASLAFFLIQKPSFISPLNFSRQKIDYSSYSFKALTNREYFKSEIRLERVLEEKPNYTSYLFSFAADGRRITGMANLPKKEGKLPAAILLRGWVDEKIYQTGMGSKNMAAFLAENGFVTLAPDFLGYGGSDSAFPDMLQTRFFRPITVISLLNSVFSLPQADPDKMVIWAHSNGGQIALSVLEITQKEIPTSLWAPVSAPFPESILFFASEMEDEGRLIRTTIGDFEKKYSFADFSIETGYQKISAPLLLHQGLADESIPFQWSDQLAEDLKNLKKEVTYYRYPNENHNFTQGSAPTVRARDLRFFKKQLEIN
ncbi:MAG TPA: prolyl oligopeptidase family serine peptidase [Candidatus Bathyarchaeia archaeon]|nr:prolyl oligopeptidase family serine peptidase [Candidatus Bathyarchaeia archaeon]